MKKTLLPFLFIASLFLTTCAPNENVEFLNSLSLSPKKNNNFVLSDDFKIRVDDNLLIIPKGFETDLASIPRVFWPIAAPHEYKNIAPAIIHDYQYTCPKNLTREKIDSIFYSSLIDNRVNPVVAYGFWLAVRVGGASHFIQDIDCAITDKTSD
jgi:hypothetical protein